MSHLLEIWDGQQLLEPGEELANERLQRGVKIRAVLHWEHVLCGQRMKGCHRDAQKTGKIGDDTLKEVIR